MRKNYADSASMDRAIEGQSPAENCTNTVSRATPAAKQPKQKLIAATKQVVTALLLQHLPQYHQLHELLVCQLS